MRGAPGWPGLVSTAGDELAAASLAAAGADALLPCKFMAGLEDSTLASLPLGVPLTSNAPLMAVVPTVALDDVALPAVPLTEVGPISGLAALAFPAGIQRAGLDSFAELAARWAKELTPFWSGLRIFRRWGAPKLAVPSVLTMPAGIPSATLDSTAEVGLALVLAPGPTLALVARSEGTASLGSGRCILRWWRPLLSSKSTH